jgi:hypothetical protein
MKIRLIDFDSRIPNLALMKLSAWHKSRGDTVGFRIRDPDKVYVSVIFSKNRAKSTVWKNKYPDIPAIFGGTGWDLTTTLPEEVELMKPDYDLYPSTFSQGYTTRGCIRNCGFCVVPEKEGKIRVVQHPSYFHDDRFDTCMIMDNNLFASPKTWQEKVFSWFLENDVKMRSPQGWDVRLLTPDRANTLYRLNHVGVIHFAWDNIEDEKRVFSAIELLKETGFDLKHEISFYVLCGYNTSFEQDLYRCQKLKEAGVQAYAMRYTRSPKLNALARWTARPELFWSVEFSEYTRKGVRA